MTERDAHLRQALRHAPDAQLQAPPALSELILKEARAKARDPHPVPPATPGWLARVWHWLARPVVATGFAGVMAATLVGLMWWDQPMDEALPRSPVPAAMAPVPAAAPPLAKAEPAPSPAALSAPPATPEKLSEKLSTAPATRTAQPPAAKRGAEATPKAEQAARPALPAAPPQTTTTDRLREQPPGPQTEQQRADMADAAPQRNAAAPAPVMTAPAPPAPPPAPTGMSVEAGAAGTVSKAKSNDESKLQRSVAPAEAHGRSAGATAQFSESRARREAEAVPRLSNLRSAIVSEPARWSWQRGQASAQPMNDALYAWLAQVDGAATTGWRPYAERDTTATLGRALQLLRDGRVAHTLQLTERGVLWHREQQAFDVLLSPEQVAALQSALGRIAP